MKIIEIKNFSAFYGEKKVVKNVSFDIFKNKITAIIGPSGCGKSTLLRSVNRINDNIPGFKIEGNIYFEGKDIYDGDVDVTILRKKIGMVFQKPVPFPMSIYDNVSFGLKIHGIKRKEKLDEIVEKSLKQAALWDEVRQELNEPASELSGGQQQRLCIARTLAIQPEVLLLDEPTSALDPIATQKIEALLEKLSEFYTIAIVTHNLSQAIRISDYVAFMYQGELIEFADTPTIVKKPQHKLTEAYLNGKIG
ncbi:phosphate ABC transporter ATP-binding protein [Thermosipho melanesiensis]|uniref:Phosphate ABC transporter, ATPase subunit n=2 Tax=Thermosipho melanesiensis TaxID=46541 RepID=A6LP10_THEM4|nr:phosphate ABC transporter ATP-binding protein PstB [Thermosipho melanesiensis]ABR31661.1 phosphate ABC transporter, ATPase subunit [Thermosipho melanesiensis BI429]APT74688.1 phosphate ABC transporter ATP-binding protein [Thermosipho melanesiensis]OOC35185.1 phosphate ABC transporter ATP-binding protein [Thermosipho melanesiensis]OOC35395.1 phosphate ABC transporter ATP-binding protein [Thermosipho melanesiensis]OOC36646.1 phosphate ABC transporter ATP-binding protein [Thermosipho melanesie